METRSGEETRSDSEESEGDKDDKNDEIENASTNRICSFALKGYVKPFRFNAITTIRRTFCTLRNINCISGD